MTDAAVFYSRAADSTAAGRELGEQIKAAFGAIQGSGSQPRNGRPDAVVVFASSTHDYGALLRSLQSTCEPRCMMGSSSAGEFSSSERGEGAACALALRSSEMSFSIGVGRGLARDRREAARSVVASFRGLEPGNLGYRSALVMTDALAGHADEIVDELTLATRGQYQFFGGGAGDDAKFQRTHVFVGTEAITDAVVALEILSKKPLGIGVSHGWEPASAPLRVTEVDGMRLVSLNAMPALEAFVSHAATTGQQLDITAPMAFFLHNIIGIDTGHGHRLRVPLSIHDDGSISCAADIPAGAIVHIMKSSAQSAIEAASEAARNAVTALGAAKPRAALVFDCVATRLRMGDAFGFELQGVADVLGGTSFAGCNTYGQIARADGQFGGFHNCTAVVCVIPE